MRVDVNAQWDDEPAAIGRKFYRRRYEWEQDGYDVSDVGAGSAMRSDQEALALLNTSDGGGYEPAHESH